MGRGLKTLVATLLTICVLLILVSPLVSLQPTAMRAWQLAQVMATALVAAAFVFCGYRAALVRRPVLVRAPSLFGSAIDLLSFECSRLC